MGYSIREIEAGSQFCRQITVDVINQVVPLPMMETIIAECGVCQERVRKLPALLTMVMCIAMNLFSELSLPFVLVAVHPPIICVVPDAVVVHGALPRPKSERCSCRHIINPIQLRSI